MKKSVRSIDRAPPPFEPYQPNQDGNRPDVTIKYPKPWYYYATWAICALACIVVSIVTAKTDIPVWQKLVELFGWLGRLSG
ncbi:MAG: hypothetical protein HQ592_01605 [Planctomycetes bacterium]|nr:hypothetical protein [Planctomycetota bacterium]